jgi:hypothetical protein
MIYVIAYLIGALFVCSGMLYAALCDSPNLDSDMSESEARYARLGILLAPVVWPLAIAVLGFALIDDKINDRQLVQAKTIMNTIGSDLVRLKELSDKDLKLVYKVYKRNSKDHAIPFNQIEQELLSRTVESTLL